jgi:hypothetical protein
MTALGADVQQLDRLAYRLEQQATVLRSASGGISQVLARTAWRGRTADDFRQTWTDRHAKVVLSAAERFEVLAREVRRQAAEQRLASGEITLAGVPRLGLLGRALDAPILPGGLSTILGLAGDRSNGDFGIRVETGADGRRRVVGFERSATLDRGPFSGEGSVDITGLGVEGSAEAHAGLDADGLAAGAGVGGAAVIAAVAAAGSIGAGPFGAAASGRAMVGVEGKGDVGVTAGPSGVGAKIGGEVFAGAKAEADASGHISGVRAGAGGSVRAGLGAQAGADAHVGLDEIRLEANAGLVVGLGGSVSFDVSVKPSEVVRDVVLFAKPFD